VIGDLNDGLISESTTTISRSGLESSSAKWVSPGSVLVAMYGSIGKLGITAAPLTTNQAIAFTDPNPVPAKYLFWFLKAVRRDLVALGKGGTQSNISQTVIKAFPFLLPPLAEQHRIVAAIEEQTSRLDSARDALRRVQANLKRCRASVLKAACEGRLVPTEAELARREGREYEPADVLLERIVAERRARWEAEELAKLARAGKVPKGEAWKQKYKEPASPDTADLPEIPEGWAWTSLAAIADLKGGVTKGQRNRQGDEVRSVPYLRVANVQRGYLDLSDVKEIEAPEAKIDELRLLRGDVLFNEGGDRDKLGRGWVWQGEIPECIHQNHVFRARLYTQGVQPKFVSWYGNSLAQRYFMEEGKQTTNLASINLTKLGALPVPLPPLAEQERIIAEVERRLSALDALEATVERDLRRAERLRQSILKRAFEGKLVPQDPSDEPASALLERIRSERQTKNESRPPRRARQTVDAAAD
jgi:type I restriction enzyme S subunit